MLCARLFLSGLALILAAGSWRPAPTLAQLPAGTPTYNVNAKWVTDRGSQVFNVKAYGATGNGTTDDTTAINATFTAAGVGGHILFPPGNYVVSSKLNWATNLQTIEGYGAYILCNQTSASICVQIGNASNPDAAGGITIQGLGFTPGPNSATSAIIADNAQGTRFVDVNGGTQTPSACSSQPSGICHYGYFIENEDDQAEPIDHLYNVGNATCTAAFCGAAVYQPYSGSDAGITWVQNSNLSMGCAGNSIDWQSGQNHLTVSHSILQAFSQFALRSFYNVDVDGFTHWEQGSCTNPLNDGSGHALGGAGLILNGASATVEGNAVGGVTGTVFSTNASGGSSTYWYYVVGHTAGGNKTAALIAGYLNNGPSTISSPSAVVYAVWPALTASGITTFDLLATQGTVPYGTGMFAVATGLAVGTYCTASGGLVCAYTDTGSRSSYTVPGENWYPGDTFWPGNLVLFGSQGAGSSNIANVGSYSGPQVSSMLVNAAPGDTEIVHVNFTGPGHLWNGGSPPYYGFIVEGDQYTFNYPASARLIPLGSALYPTKGFFNFGSLGNKYNGMDFVTIADSNLGKTFADQWKHPTWDAADTALCGDAPYATGACLRGPTVSQYLGVLPDGSHWATRTASTGIADAVPHYGFQSISAGAPNTPTLGDASSATTCQTSHFYYPGNICFDGTNFEMASLLTSSVGVNESGPTAPTWATTPGQTTYDGSGNGGITWICLGAGSLTANTTYYFKTAGCTLGGCSGATSEASITTANDSASHMVLVHGVFNNGVFTSKVGHISYQVGCSTTTNTEALLTAPYTGAYTGNAYLLPAMGCSGSGGFNASDQTGTIAGTATAASSLASGVTQTRRTCDIAIGDESSSTAITNAQLGPQKRLCYVPAAATVIEMDVAADQGTPQVIVGRNHAGTIANIVSAALATAGSGGIACSSTGGTTGLDGATTCTNTLQNTSLSAGDYLELVSGTAGGAALLMTIHVIYTIP
jgi:hypothetical protein